MSGSPYLHKIYDTISVRDSKVGLGTDTPQGTLHVLGSALFHQIGSVLSNIDFTSTSLSNISAIHSQGIVVNFVTTNNASCNIDVYNKSLSNISSVSTRNLTSDGSTLNISGKSLSNVSSLSVAKITSVTDSINLDAKSLSNVSNLSVENVFSPQSFINFQNNTLSNVFDLSVARHAIIGGTLTASNLTITGDFSILNTTTSNMEQLNIINAGTGPALRVVQTGVGTPYSVAEFIDGDNGSALMIADTGLVGINTSSPLYRLDVRGSIAVRDAVYLKTGGMNKILYGCGNVLRTTLGAQSFSIDIEWTNVSSIHRHAFRLMAKFHVVSERPSTAYRRIESIVTPMNDAGDGYPAQLSVVEMSNCTTADFNTITHAIVRRGSRAVTLTFAWNSSIQPAIANVDLEVFANEALGDFTFTPGL